MWIDKSKEKLCYKGLKGLFKCLKTWNTKCLLHNPSFFLPFSLPALSSFFILPMFRDIHFFLNISTRKYWTNVTWGRNGQFWLMAREKSWGQIVEEADCIVSAVTTLRVKCLCSIYFLLFIASGNYDGFSGRSDA